MANKLSLENFRLAAESANDHIVITDPDGVVLFANAAAAEITGYSVKEIVGGTPKLWGGLMPESFYSHLWDTVKIHKQPYAGELTNRRKNGETYTAELHISPVLAKNGEVELFIAVERDISTRVKIESSKTEFVSLASHQLRTPLSTLNWYSEILLSGELGKLSKQQQQYTKEIYKASQRMIRLVNDLLNLSRIEMGKMTIQPNHINLKSIIEDITEDLQHDLKLRQLTLAIHYPDKKLELFGDQQIINIVITNLLSNAMKYSPKGGKVAIDISFKNASTVAIVVSDSGMGIPDADKSKIFTKFFRAENAKVSVSDGTGLGLYIVKAFVESAGGSISFKSSSHGTVFTVLLPIKMRSKIS